MRVNKGGVTLSGAFHTWYEKSHAAEIATWIKGVKDVINLIGVDEHHPSMMLQRSDAIVTRHVEAALVANWATRWVADDIQVSVENGVATLTGEVDIWNQRKQEGDVACSARGAWKVKNKLAVASYHYDWDYFDF